MSQYEVDDIFMVLPCLHRFHNECVGEWFKRKNTCPNCKDNVSEHFKREDDELGGQSEEKEGSNSIQIFNNNNFQMRFMNLHN